MPPSDRLTEPGSSTVQKQNPADEGCHFYSRSLILCKSESRRKGCRFLQVIIIIAVRQPHLAPGRYLLAGDQAKESTPAGTVGGHQAGIYSGPKNLQTGAPGKRIWLPGCLLISVSWVIKSLLRKEKLLGQFGVHRMRSGKNSR